MYFIVDTQIDTYKEPKESTVVSRYYDIIGMGNIYRNIRTIVITVKLSPEKQRRWWAIIQVHVR